METKITIAGRQIEVKRASLAELNRMIMVGKGSVNFEDVLNEFTSLTAAQIRRMKLTDIEFLAREMFADIFAKQGLRKNLVLIRGGKDS